MEEYIKNLEQNKTKNWIAKKIWIGWLANRSRSGTKKQKRGLLNNLDSLKKELWSVNFAIKSKKTPKNKLKGGTQ
jgi:hypothetical protein